MAAKVNFNTATKRIEVTATPVGGVVTLDVQVDLYSDGVIDWETTLLLRGHTFPIQPIGGQTTAKGKLGTTYILRDPWQIAPLEQNHTLEVDGNIFTELGGDVVADSVGSFNVRTVFTVSTLVEVVEAVEATEINTKLDRVDTGVYGLKGHVLSIDPLNGVPGYLLLWSDDPTPVYLGYKEIWEDYAATIGFRDRGIGLEGKLLAGFPPGYVPPGAGL